MLLLLWSYATVVVLGRKSETILPNKIVRRFLFFGVFWIVSDFVRTRTTQDCDGPEVNCLFLRRGIVAYAIHTLSW